MRRIMIEKNNVDIKNYSLGCPWRYDVTAHNFQFPEEVISVSDIKKIDYWEDIQSLVIRCDLDNYDFIAKMINLRQLYIYMKGRTCRIFLFLKTCPVYHIYI